MFHSIYEGKLDDKNRMRMPAKFREQLGEDYKIVQGYNGCLFAMTKTEFEKFVQQFASISMGDIMGQFRFSKIMSTVFVPEEDSQGRFVLPANNRREAKIEKKLTFIGVYNRVEIWSTEERNKFEEKYEQNIDMNEIYSSLCVPRGDSDGI